MPSDDLFRLWQLHLVDKAILEIRSQAAALDPGKKLMAEIVRLEAQATFAEEGYRSVHGEQTDIELKQKGIDEKVKRFDRDLYGGKVVNPREVENLQKEIELLKRQRSELDERLLELWEVVPPAKQKLDLARDAIQAKKAELADYQKRLVIHKANLEAAFKEATAKRPAALENVDKGMLAKYDAIRQKHSGLGMSRIEKNGSCELCGTLLPRKTVETAKDGRWVTCEACHRVLYWSESIV